MKVFGKILRELRKEKNLSQKQLAESIGTTFTNLSRWELGQFEPDFNTLIKISSFFNVTTDYLLGLENEIGIKINNINNSFNCNKGQINFKN